MIWHSAPLKDALKQLGTDESFGLARDEAERRLNEVGPNRLKEGGRTTVLQKFAEQFKDFMVIILVIAAVISFVTGYIESGKPELVEPIIIISIVVLNAVLGVFQESRAEAALDALKNMSAPNAKVVRNGVVTVIPSADLVPGDVINLEAGDFIPADGRIISASSLRCDEASLTGESVPSEKYPTDDLTDIATIGDRHNMVYSGCAVSYGYGKVVITQTAMNTEMGKIASILENTEDTITPLKLKLAQLGKMLGILALVICAIIFVVGTIEAIVDQHEIVPSLIENFMVAVSLAVAAIPEGLPAIVTIVLALGVKRMVKKNAIIRQLPAVETLGSATYICSDKTGTLTQNVMTLVEVFDGSEMKKLGEELGKTAQQAIIWGTLCCDATVEEVDGKTIRIGDPTETAIVEAAAKYCGHTKKETDSLFPRMGDIPFDSDRKLMTTINMIDGKPYAIVKGAPDILLSRCVTGNIEAASNANEEMAQKALRVLAVATKPLDDIPSNPTSAELEYGLNFVGLLGMIDPPRVEAGEAVTVCSKAGISTVMITGDHLTTAVAIAKNLGIMKEGKKAIAGADLANISDKELHDTVEDYAVYARVSPSDKIRIVQALQGRGHVVAMTGDGVNDAPALKAADIGCAMGITGSDVAKGAASMVLTDDNFATIVAAVEQGRGIYDNIRKAVHFLISCNLGEIITVFVSMILFRVSPLLPIQLLWINLVTDSAPALALGMEPAEKDVMSRKPRRKDESIFAGGLGISVIWQGIMFGALTVLAFFIGSGGDPADPTRIGHTMAFAVLAFAQIVHSLNIHSKRSIFVDGLHRNPPLILATLFSAGLMLLVLMTPMSELFKVVIMNADQWKIVALLALSPLVICELVKLVQAIIRKVKK